MSLIASDNHATDPEDAERGAFLDALDDSPPEIDVTEWEAEFLNDNLGKSSFTPAQREVIDKLREKYEERL